MIPAPVGSPLIAEADKTDDPFAFGITATLNSNPEKAARVGGSVGRGP